MSRQVLTKISVELYNKVISEKKRLKKIESNKVKSRRKIITMEIASRGLARGIR